MTPTVVLIALIALSYASLVYSATRSLQSDDSYLANWMDNIMPAIKDLTLLDLSLPGTHDTFTYDLSLRTSDGGADGDPTLAKILHDFHAIVPGSIESFIKDQAVSQTSNITTMLDNGIRFIDMRIMYEYSDSHPDWYSLHFLESNNPAMTYFTQIKDWMEAHPSEIIVMFLSKHGNTCNKGTAQYPNTPPAVKQAFWAKIQDTFGNLLVDFSKIQINTAHIDKMVQSNQRVVIYSADYAEFTNSSVYALDACLDDTASGGIDNTGGPGAYNIPGEMEFQTSYFMNSSAHNAELKMRQGFSLIHMATAVGTKSTEYAASIKYLSAFKKIEEKKCAAEFNIPGFGICPPTLMDISQLHNFYSQINMEKSHANGWGFPNAIYLDGLDADGTIRTGTMPLQGGSRDSDPTHYDTKYAYVDTMIYANINRGCDVSTRRLRGSGGPSTLQCNNMLGISEDRRAVYPITLWEENTYGRHVKWVTAKPSN
jgi:hypothetical protein